MGSHKRRPSQRPYKLSKAVECIACILKFSSIHDLREHFQIHLFGKKFQCTVCLERFPSRDRLRSHEQSHNEASVGESKHSNMDVIESATGNEDLKNGERSHTPPSVHLPSQSDIKTEQKVDDYSCAVCPKTYKTRRSFMKHSRSHATAIFQCKHCYMRFRLESNLLKHIRSHEISTCPVCKIKVSQKHFREHLIKHTEGNKCLLCEKVFNEKADLLEHHATHMKLHKCSVCQKRFISESKLSRHFGTHTKVKASVSDEKFSREDQSLKHKCPICEKVFAHWYRLRDHLNAHTREMECVFCKMKYPRRYGKRCKLRHLVTHTVKESVCQTPVRNGSVVEQYAAISEGNHCPDEKNTGNNEGTEDMSEVAVSERKFSQENSNLHSLVVERPFEYTEVIKSEFNEDSSCHTVFHSELLTCSECHECFDQASSLQDHLMTHSFGNQSLEFPGQAKSSERIRTPNLSAEQTLNSANCHLKFDSFIQSDSNGTPLNCSGCEQNGLGGTSIDEKLLQCSPKSSRMNQLCAHPETPHQDSKEFECSDCPMKFKKVTSLQRHLIICHGSRLPLQECSACDKKFKLPMQLHRHMRLFHGRSKAFECAECGLRFTSLKFLQRHLQSHDGEKTHECSLCQKKFSQRRHLQFHHSTAHRAVRPFRCPECQERFTHEGYMRIHQRKHLRGRCEKPFKCSECDMKFWQAKLLHRHLEMHRDAAFECSVCQLKFSRLVLLRSHLRIAHEPEVPSECPECHRKFKVSGGLEKHLAVPKASKMLECNICGKDFSRLHCLRFHILTSHAKNTSSGEATAQAGGRLQLLACPKCQQKFSHPGHLNRHLVSHTEEETLECDLCEEKFSRERFLKSHMAVVHKIGQSFKCRQCKKKFKHRGFLLRHVSISHGEEPEESCAVAQSEL